MVQGKVSFLKIQVMNGFAIKVGELILWEMKATPWILYLKPLKCIKNVMFEMKHINIFNFMDSGVLGIKNIAKSWLGSRWDNS